MGVVFFLALLIGLIVLVMRLLNSSKSEQASEPTPEGFSRSGPPPSPSMASRHTSALDLSNRSVSARERPGKSVPQSATHIRDDKPVLVTPSIQVASPKYSLPTAPREFGAGRWIPEGQPVTVGGVTIPGGMLYVGSSLNIASGENDPCLIDPSLPVATMGDYTEDLMGYWPSYSRIAPQARRAYLKWLSDGRKDPKAEIGYVFLFFYGLERRAIIDARNDESAKHDRPRISAELRQLLEVYGHKSNSFRRYAGELLDWVSFSDRPPRLYDQPIPTFSRNFELPLHLRLALGQAAVDEVPVPSRLALAWARVDQRVCFRTAARRCPEQFEHLFAEHYASEFGTGLILPHNRTKLKFVYRPASSSFAGQGEFNLTFDNLPDVTVLAAPIKKLQSVVDLASEALAPFSRFIGRNPTAGNSLEAQFLLPPSLWPEKLRRTLEELKSRLTGEAHILSLADLAGSLGATSVLTRENTRQLARALAANGIGFEPDVMNGARSPKPDDSVVLFSLVSPEVSSTAHEPYFAAVLTLQLASTVAMADGEFGSHEVDHLRESILSWKHLSVNHSRRLLAHLQLLTRAPITLARLRKKLDGLDYGLRETLASFMASVAQSDGVLSAAEVKLLERVYRALDVNPEKVFSDLHAVSTDEKPPSGTVMRAETAGLKLDVARIAELQRDTARVSAMLAHIFTEDDDSATPATVEAIGDELEGVGNAQGQLLGLDDAHSTLARTMLSRLSWGRKELLDLAEDLELMLDGALEHMSEAALDAHGIPFFEGDDPVTVNPEILEKLDQ